MKITVKLLKELYEKQTKNTRFSSKPKRMFKDGLFTSNNWNGGDDLIRDFLSDVQNEEIKNSYIVDMDDYEIILISHVDRIDDTTFATIIYGHDVYYFSWYKDRGCTEIAKKNGSILTENEYIDLLNTIIETGYKFDLER